MRLVDRSALVVRPKEPFARWLASVDPLAEEEGAVASLRDQVSVYLVADDPEGSAESAPIKNYSGRIFEYELEKWFTDPDRWPKNRSYATFKKWFDVQAESVVVDLECSSLDWDEF